MTLFSIFVGKKACTLDRFPVVRFKPVEKNDKFLMAFNHCIKSPVNDEIRKYKNIIHVVSHVI